MSATPTPKNNVGNAIKLYIFPVLVTILATLIWRDVSELRSDVKALLSQSSIDKTKIENLEKDVKALEQAVFNKRMVATTDFIVNHDRFFKHEDVFDITKYIPKF
jgi:Na+-translocating ferredoxin:NAD+ oxidoreductase RnfD subunit